MVQELIRDNITTKLQRDIVSGKLMRTSVVSTCPYCVSTPEIIALTFNGLVDCTCLSYFGPTQSRKPIGVATLLNGQTFLLAQYGDPVHEYSASPCQWARTFEGYFGTLKVYLTADCTGSYVTRFVTKLMIAVARWSSDRVLIEVDALALLGTDPSDYTTFPVYAYGIWTGSYWGSYAATITDCITVTNLANQLTCGLERSTLPLCSSGTVSTTEILTGYTLSQIRIPTSDASLQWSPGSNNYALVNDPPSLPDDDASYTFTNTGTYKDYFNFPSFTIPAESTITNLQVTGRFKRIDAGGSYLARLIIRVGGITYYGPSELFLLGAYFTRTATWPNNPQTGSAWTIADINGTGLNPLQAFGYECMGFKKTVRCTQVYSKVNYTN